MAIIVTLPILAPTGLTTTLVSGGTLAANTTYYYVVVAYDQNSIPPSGAGVYGFHSPISAEGSFTTDTVNKSVLIKWSNVTNATRYNILVTTVSGNYTNSGGYNGIALEAVGNITSGTVGNTVTALSTDASVFHTIQLVNPLVGGIDKKLGLLKVDLSAAGNCTLDDIYNAIIAAGYSGYTRYDGYQFIFKGWFIVTGTLGGTCTIQKKRLVFIKGGVGHSGTNYIIRFGLWTSDAIGANYGLGCSIDIQNGRNPFYGVQLGKLQVYGCEVTMAQSLITTQAEIKTNGYFNGNLTTYLSFNVSEIRDNILMIPGRSITSDIKDTKWAHQNNWGDGKHLRLKVWTNALMPYSAINGGFYKCEFPIFPNLFSFYSGAPLFTTNNYHTNFYDCSFTGYPNGMLVSPYVSYISMTLAAHTSDQYFNVNNTVKTTVLNKAGQVLSGVTISGTDSLGNPIEWIEHDITIDRAITGNIFTTNRTTDALGQIDYYLRAYKINLNPANTAYPNSTDIIKTNYYPFTLTFSKAGYRNYQVKLNTLAAATEMTLTLEAQDIRPEITSVAITQPTAVNNNGQIAITATGGTGALQYSIGSAYQAGNTFTGLSGATYTVSVKDTLNLVDSIAGVKLVAPAFLIPSITSVAITQPTAINNDGQLVITATGGTPSYTYSIGGAYQASATFTGLSGGTYNVSVKDSLNQINTVTGIKLVAPAFLKPSITTVSITQPTAINNDGQIVVNASGGTAPYQYSIGGAYQASATFTGLSGSTYTISVKDVNNQIDSIAGVKLVAPAFLKPTITLVSIVNPSAYNNDGLIVITATGGTAPYTYSKGGNFLTGNTFTGLSGGTYVVKVKDVNNQVDTISGIILTAPAFLKPIIYNLDMTNPDEGLTNGQIIIHVSGGTPAYQYNINNGGYQVSNTFNGLSGGTYYIGVKDSQNQLDYIQGLILTQPLLDEPKISGVIIHNPTRYQFTDGSIQIFATGGTSPYTYNIGFGYQVSNTFNGLSGGTYNIYIRDVNNLVDSHFGILLTEPLPVIPKINNIIITDAKSTIESTGSIKVLVSGGTAPYMYKLNDGNYQSSNIFTGLPAGVYNLVVKDSFNQINTLAGIKVGAGSIGGAYGRGWSRRKYAPEVNVRNVSIKDKDNDLKEEIKIRVTF